MLALLTWRESWQIFISDLLRVGLPPLPLVLLNPTHTGKKRHDAMTLAFM